MEGKDWVLVSKEDENLYIKLTHKKVGASKGNGRAVWEWTEDFNEAAGFRGYATVADAVKKHKIPIHNVKLRPYENAFSTYLKHQANKKDL